MNYNLLQSSYLQTFLVESKFMQNKIQEPLTKHFSRSKFEYLNIEQQLTSTPEWPPPISKSTSNLAELMRLESVASNLTVEAYDDDQEAIPTQKPNEAARSRGQERRVAVVVAEGQVPLHQPAILNLLWDQMTSK